MRDWQLRSLHVLASHPAHKACCYLGCLDQSASRCAPPWHGDSRCEWNTFAQRETGKLTGPGFTAHCKVNNGRWIDRVQPCVRSLFVIGWHRITVPTGHAITTKLRFFGNMWGQRAIETSDQHHAPNYVWDSDGTLVSATPTVLSTFRSAPWPRPGWQSMQS